MNQDQITALAREYAEEIVQDTDSYPELPVCLLNEMREEVAEDFEEKIRFLLRHYCLVEKSKIGEAYYIAKYNYDNVESDRDKELALAKKEILDFIIPEIAKEINNEKE